MPRDSRATRVGLTLLLALVLLAVAVLMVGEQNFLFTSTNEYYVEFRNVGGLAVGNPVQLNGVTVGKVADIILPEETDAEFLRVFIDIERRYAQRVRGDSVARIKSLGLLGDKFVEVTAGSPAFEQIETGDEIPADQPTDVDSLIASGEDVVDNIVSTATSLSNILERMDRGEGLLGELVAEREGRKVTDTLVSTLESIEHVAARIDSGEGLVGRLLSDGELADRATSAVTRIEGLLDEAENGEGLLATLISDRQTKETFVASLSDLEATLTDARATVSDLREGDGLVPRLLHDEAFAEELTGEINDLLEKLNRTADAVTTGDGTVAQLLNDESIYEAVQDIVVGVNESKLLRWLIRNRQKAGIKKRYNDEQEATPPGN
ncbi:MAG: MlaD family protein [Acidobacteriota bacterium]